MRSYRLLALLGLALIAPAIASPGVPLKTIARIQGVNGNAIVGYGLVVGLGGTGDSVRDKATRQSLRNTLQNFGVNVSERDLASRNSAAVMVMATLNSLDETGDQVDVHVASIGDARSLAGGMLVMTPLYGPDKKLYVLAQGPVSVGGYKYAAFGNSVQKNQTTVGIVVNGGTVEHSLADGFPQTAQTIPVILDHPDFVTAQRTAEALKKTFPNAVVRAEQAGKVVIRFMQPSASLVPLIARIENTRVVPDSTARVVVNERTGTVVAGGHVRINDVSVSQGNLQVVINTRYEVSQPGMFIGHTGAGVKTAIVPDTHIEVKENPASLVHLNSGATVGQLVSALQRLHMSTRDVIGILQAIKEAGALNARLIVE